MSLRQLRASLAGSALAGSIAACVLAASPAAAFQAPPGGWTVTIGVMGAAVPVFEGADSMRFRPLPIFSVRAAGTSARWRAPDDSIRIGLLEHDRLRVGVSGRLRAPREEKDSHALQGLRRVGWTPEVGVFAEIWASDVLRLSVDARQGIGGHRGFLVDMGADFVVRPEPSYTLSIGPRLAWASETYMRSYFGVDAAHSALTGLPVYRPSYGLRSVGIVASAQVALTQAVTVHAYARYDRLVGPVAEAPLVRFRGSRNQFGIGAGISYTFDFGGPPVPRWD